MIKNKKILSVILARAGSKGIKHKNVKILLDFPLFMWSVMDSLQSKYIDKTIVSSNCPQVKKIFDEYIDLELFCSVDDSIKNKLIWIQRPEEYATDTSKNEEALIHVLKEMDEEFDMVVSLQPTSPCRLDNLIDKCIEKYINGKYDSLLTGYRVTPFLWKKTNKKWKYIDGDCCDRKMRQQIDDSELLWHDSGNVYITDKDVLMKTDCRIGKNVCVFPVDKLNSLQIDTEFDFQIIEQMVKINNLKSLR